MATRIQVPVERLEVSAYTIPTDRPEADGTLEWTSTTIVVVGLQAGGETGLGYTYADVSAAQVIDTRLRDAVEGTDAMAIDATWTALVAAVRNVGRPGVAATAISAVDIALWDLKARLLELPLVRLLGGARESVPVYGSGGFISYTVDELQRQLSEWSARGIGQMKIEIGRTPAEDIVRVRAAREALGSDRSSSSTQTARTVESRPSPSPRSSLRSRSAGSRSPSPPTISRDSACCAIARPP